VEQPERIEARLAAAVGERSGELLVAAFLATLTPLTRRPQPVIRFDPDGLEADPDRAGPGGRTVTPTRNGPLAPATG
jgi:hypothetical protein